MWMQDKGEERRDEERKKKEISSRKEQQTYKETNPMLLCTSMLKNTKQNWGLKKKKPSQIFHLLKQRSFSRSNRSNNKNIDHS